VSFSSWPQAAQRRHDHVELGGDLGFILQLTRSVVTQIDTERSDTSTFKQGRWVGGTWPSTQGRRLARTDMA
jgi:hypothetical protein